MGPLGVYESAPLVASVSTTDSNLLDFFAPAVDSMKEASR